MTATAARAGSGVCVAVCDDAPMAREGLRRTLTGLPQVGRVVGLGLGEELLARYDELRPGLVFLDVRMPGLGGLETLRRVLRRDPALPVIMVTVTEDRDGVARAVAGGARGYLVKGAGREEVGALVAALLGRPDHPVRAAGTSPPAGTAPALTDRELQVLAGMARGQSNREIGRELYLAEDTVKTHARRLFRKLAAADRAQAVAVGFRWGLLR